MTDEELIKSLRGWHMTEMDAAADHIEKLGAQLKMVLEREAETQRRHEAREDTIREAALREAASWLLRLGYDDDDADNILELIGKRND